MRRFLLGLVSLSLVASAPSLTPAAFAHGGQYRGPAGEVPPDSRQPHDPPPPDSGGQTPTPPDSGGSTPTPPGGGGGGTDTPPGGGGTPDGPEGPGGGVPQPPSTGGAPTPTRRTTARRAVSYDSWRFWWGYNKDELLDLRGALRGMAGVSGGNLGVVAGYEAGGEAPPEDLTARALETRIVPVLRALAEDGSVNFDIQASGVLGLAKMGRREAAGLMMKQARNAGPDQVHYVVEETAALSLGVLQDRSEPVRAFLRDLAADPSARTRTRCFAAFSLGLLADPALPDPATRLALEALVEAPEAKADVPSSALIALGLLGDPASAPRLRGWFVTGKAGGRVLPDVTLSYAAAALGRIGPSGLAEEERREVLDALFDRIRGRGLQTRYSAVIALGQFAPGCGAGMQDECVVALASIVKGAGRSGLDRQAVNFALAALGRIGGAKDAPPAVRDRAVQVLLGGVEDRGGSGSFAALGLALVGRGLPEPERIKFARPLRELLFRMSGDYETRGAQVLALGLLRDRESVAALMGMLVDRGNDPSLRGAAAVALGLIGEQGAVEAVRAAIEEKEDRTLKVDAAVAAGLLRDGGAVPRLVAVLEDPKASQFALGSAANGLGMIGDGRAIDPLARILGDAQLPPLTRALAAVALGRMGERADVPVLSRISRDVNYRAWFEAVGEVLTIL